MPKSKAVVNIENVVASATLNQRVDLNAVVKGYPGVEYRPAQFQGLIYRMDEPKVVILLFASGNLVCTGPEENRTPITPCTSFTGYSRNSN